MNNSIISAVFCISLFSIISYSHLKTHPNEHVNIKPFMARNRLE